MTEKKLTHEEKFKAARIDYIENIKPELRKLYDYAKENNLMKAHKWLGQVSGLDKND